MLTGAVGCASVAGTARMLVATDPALANAAAGAVAFAQLLLAGAGAAAGVFAQVGAFAFATDSAGTVDLPRTLTSGDGSGGGGISTGCFGEIAGGPLATGVVEDGFIAGGAAFCSARLALTAGGVATNSGCVLASRFTDPTNERAFARMSLTAARFATGGGGGTALAFPIDPADAMITC